MRLIKNRDGFTLVEVLVALSIMSIIMLSFSSIIINSGKLYRKEIQRQQMMQKTVIFGSWLNKWIDKSSSSYVSAGDGRFTIKIKNSNKLLKLLLYQSQGVPAVGIEKYKFQKNYLRFIEKEPIINNVKDMKIEKLNSDENIINNYEIKLKFQNTDKFFKVII